MPEIKPSTTRPPECADGPIHHFVPLRKNTVYCTKCSQSVTYEILKDKK